MQKRAQEASFATFKFSLWFSSYSPNQTGNRWNMIRPVRIVNAIVIILNLDNFKKLYKETGRCPYHPKNDASAIIYAYMSCRKKKLFCVTFIISGLPVIILLPNRLEW